MRARPLAVVAALALGVSGCSGPGEPFESDVTKEGGPAPLVVSDGPLAPGTYVTSRFVRPFEITVGDDRWIVGQEAPDIVTLIGRRTELAFSKPGLVYEKRLALVPRPAPLPADLVAWLRARDDLVAGTPSPISVGGLDGTRLDVEVTELYEEAELLGCPLPCIPLAPALAPEPLFLTHTHRVLVLGSGRPLVIVYSTGDAAGERAARELLGTVRFLDGG